MCHIHGRLTAVIACFAFGFAMSGCQGEVPKPVTTAQPVSQSATSQVDTSATEPAFELEPGFALVTLDQFDSFGTEPETWSATGEGIACSGKPRGYLYSKSPYRDFTLRLDYRFPRPESLKDDAKFKGNTGFLVYINGEHKLWPSCIEVQGKFVQMASIKENGGAPAIKTETDEAARDQARKPVGQWNSIEIVSSAGALAVSLNGKSVSHSEAGTLMEGSIGIQAEDFPFEVRRMRIRAE